MADTRIMLVTGDLYDLADPMASELPMAAIVAGLSMVCRFAGQCNRFYSVAEHSVHVARLVHPSLGRAALLHDAAEALIGDVSRPLKAMLPDYRAIEARIELDIATRFAWPGQPPIDIHHPDIKAADMALCALEVRHLMPPDPDYWAGIGADPVTMERARRLIKLRFDGPDYAARAWLRAWQYYGHAEADDDGRVKDEEGGDGADAVAA